MCKRSRLGSFIYCSLPAVLVCKPSFPLHIQPSTSKYQRSTMACKPYLSPHRTAPLLSLLSISTCVSRSPQAAICDHRAPSQHHPLGSIVSVTTPENFASQRLIGKQLGSPVELVEVWPSWDCLAQYEKSIGWVATAPVSPGDVSTPRTASQPSHLDFYPGRLGCSKGWGGCRATTIRAVV